MRKTIILLSVLLHCVVSFAQNEYSIVSGGQGKNGEFLVRVTTVVKDIKTAQAELKRCAVHGVLFRGFMGENSGDPSQQPLVQDSGVEHTKAEFFNTFFTQKEHENYVAIVSSSFSSMKLKRKNYEVSALLLVNKERLLHHLEEAGIIKGFSNLW